MKYEKTLFVIFNFLFLYFGNAQSVPISISTGISYSTVRSLAIEWRGDMKNPWRRGFWASVEGELLSRRHFRLDATITYQERVALENFPFNTGDVSATGVWVFAKWPSNPQNELFELSGFERFPNFKYLHIESAPSIVLVNRKLFVSMGIGGFVGVLLNKNQTTITKENFPGFEGVFETRQINHDIEYTGIDVGWMPKLNIHYRINNELKIGIIAKTYQSLYRLNDSRVFERKFKDRNVRWSALLVGINFIHEFKAGAKAR
ncbi:MAG: hypothetical protein R2795_16985 [Saprospiraceae bacterium]